ncbi:MAG TPA: zinc-ribbon domain-containing protein [Verrucomicrobiae bacterium]|nr:zinc-ribbon domain-containing protein [Verrucomicrobiae bacterium]
MAFCNSCGSNLAPGAKFCTKCGAVVTGAPTSPAAIASSPAITPGPVAPKAGGSAVKIILIVVGVLVIFGVLGVATLAIIGVHIARRTHISQDGNRVKVETPFGSVDTNKDPQEVAKDLGVDIYPGAQPQASGSAIATFGGVRTASASFLSSDSVDKVCDFYRSKFPNATSSTSTQNHCSIVSGDQGNIVTIAIEPSGNSTKIQITSVNKSSTNSN